MELIETNFGIEASLKEFSNVSKKEQDGLIELFITESNAIENIFVDTTGTVSFIGDEPTEEDTWRAFPEYIGHREAFLYMMDYFPSGSMTRADILQMHEMLGRYTIKDAGHWRKCPIYITTREGNQVFYEGKPYYSQLPRLMAELEGDMQAGDSLFVTDEHVWNLHHKFEVFHPFVDGNGRLGRLLLNWNAMRHLGKIIIVQNEKKQLYYEMIREFEKNFSEVREDVKFYKNKYKPYVDLYTQFALNIMLK